MTSPVPADRVMQQVPVRPDPELDRRRVGKAGQVLDGNQPAEAAATGVDLVVVPDHQLAHDRARAIGTDHEIGLRIRAVRELDRDLAVLLGIGGDLLAEMDPVATDGVGEDLLEVRTMDAMAGSAVSARLGLVVPCDDVTIATVSIDERRRLPRHVGERLPQTPPLDEARRIRRQVHRSTDLAEFGGALVDLGVEATLAKRKCEGEASDSCADDRNPGVGSDHEATP